MTTTAPARPLSRPSVTTVALMSAALLAVGLAIWVAISVIGGRTSTPTLIPRPQSVPAAPNAAGAGVDDTTHMIGEHTGAAAETHFYGPRQLVDGNGSPVVTTPSGSGRLPRHRHAERLRRGASLLRGAWRPVTNPVSTQ